MGYQDYMNKKQKELASKVAEDFVATDFIHLTEIFEQISRYVMIRHFRVGEFSKYYNEETREGIGGPKYKYDDYLIHAYSTATLGSRFENSGLTASTAQTFETVYYQYYLSKECITVDNNVQIDTIIKENDEIYELNYFGKEKPTIVYSKEEEDISKNIIVPKKMFRIKHIIPLKTSNGRLQFYKVIAGYDITNG